MTYKKVIGCLLSMWNTWAFLSLRFFYRFLFFSSKHSGRCAKTSLMIEIPKQIFVYESVFYWNSCCWLPCKCSLCCLLSLYTIFQFFSSHLCACLCAMRRTHPAMRYLERSDIFESIKSYWEREKKLFFYIVLYMNIHSTLLK